MAAPRGRQDDQGWHVSETASVSAGIAGRYASAVFDLAREGGGLDALDRDIAQLDQALADSADLRAMVASPLLTREEQGAAIGAIAARMGLSRVMANTLALMAQKRRLFVLAPFLAALRGRLAEARGEVTAEVASATPLSPDQEARLAASLREAAGGRAVRLRTRVQPDLLGGLVVRLGSRMIDTSVRARLGALQTVLRDAG